MLARGERTQKTVLAVGVVIVVVLAAGAVAVATDGGQGSDSSKGRSLGNGGAAPKSDIREAGGASGQGHGPSNRRDGSGRLAPATTRSLLASSERPASRTARVTALERAVGKNPKRTKVVPQVPNSARVRRGEALPCTGEGQPINFEIFSAGASVAGLPVTDYSRRCDQAAPANQDPANYTNYLYGECEITTGATGCQLPLEIQSFPACQRALADYTVEGRPIPYKELGKIGEAVVVEIDLMGEPRVEVYTGSTTVVIFATEWALAQQALTQLTSQQAGTPPAATAGELDTDPDPSLAPPSEGAIQGELPCRS
jgi:hypothetical protein